MHINFTNISSTSWYGYLLRLPLKLLPPEMILPVLQGELRGCRWIVGASTHGCWLGSYELAKQRAIASTIQPGDVFYDIGANVGFYTLLAALRTGESGHVHGFEPVERNLNYLRRHLTLNKVNNVTIHEMAVARKTGELQFVSGANPAEGRLAPIGNFSVQAIALDSFIAEQGLRQPDILKIDVEGAEFDVLCGAKQTLTQNSPVIFLATHGPEIKHQCIRLLRDMEYAIESLDDHPVHARNQFGELLATKRITIHSIRGC